MSMPDGTFTGQRNCSIHIQLGEAVSALGLLMGGPSLTAPTAPSSASTSCFLSHPSGTDAQEEGYLWLEGALSGTDDPI